MAGWASYDDDYLELSYWDGPPWVWRTVDTKDSPN
ncbi:hypothetical protein, partial [Mesorhizobium marinum]